MIVVSEPAIIRSPDSDTSSSVVYFNPVSGSDTSRRAAKMSFL